MTGRAKPRARGRARGAAAEQAEPVRRPGSAQQPQQQQRQRQQQQQQQRPAQAQRPPPQAAAPPAPAHGVGRASHRGGARAEPRPGGDAPVREMAGLNIGGAGAEPRDRASRFIEPVTRPSHVTVKQGTSGKHVPLYTNYFKLEAAPNWVLYQYHVSFSPEVESKRFRQILVKQHRELLGETRAFDGMVLFLAKRLPQDVTEVISCGKQDETQKINVTFRLTRELPPDSPTCMQMYNVIFNRILNMIEMKQIGRHYYSPEAGVTIPQHNLEVWPGFITSILQYESSVLLCAEVSHKIMRTDTVCDLMYSIHRQSRDFHADAQRQIIGQIVLTRYNNKTYRIDDIAWDKNPSSTFPKRDGSQMSFIDYYKQNYNIDIHGPDQPMLVSNPKKSDQRRGQTEPILLVPELCTMTGLTDEARADFNIMRDVAVHTRLGPDRRVGDLYKFIKTITQNESVHKELTGWGLRFSEDLVNVKGRILPDEKIIQRNRRGEADVHSYNPSEADWSRGMRGKFLCQPMALNNWLLIVPQRDVSKAEDFFNNLARVGPPMGMQIGEPIVSQIPNDSSQNYIKVIKESLQRDTQLVCCILSGNKKDRYDAIKKLCCIQMPVPSQVIVARTLSKPKMLMSVATKIAIQLNCKLGGEVWEVEIPLKGLMVVGIDCYHDSAKKGRTVGGFIASMNKPLTKFYSRCTFQTTMQELISQLQVCFVAALKQYHSYNGALPERIMIYRDGVGDGQLNAVFEHEVHQIISCFKELGQDYDPRLAFIVVKKRINTRFFAQAGRQLSNPPPGTVVDDTVTKAEWYDFFLVSQSVRQGTVTPTHYNVIWDTLGLTADRIQRLTYKLTHLYYNWPGTIRVPAPCQYAHKLAFLVGQSLHEDPGVALSDKLFFL